MVLNNLLGSATLSRLADAEVTYGPQAYRLMDFFQDLDQAMWTELRSNDSITVFRRNLQRIYTDKLLDLAAGSRSDRLYRDVVPIAIQQLESIQSRLKKAMSRAKDPMTEYHLKYLYNRVAAFNRKETGK